MSFPHTEDVIAGLQAEKPDIEAAITLLRQYFTLCTTQAAQNKSLRESSARADVLKARIVELETKCREMEAHPDVIAAKRTKLEQQKSEIDAQLAELSR